MAYRLKSRQMQIPFGYKFLQRETGWKPRPYSSFSSVVSGLIAHRNGNATLLKKGASIDPNDVAQEVELYNVQLCLENGWMNFIIGGGASAPLPKPKAPSPSEQKQLAAVAGRVQKIWSGVRTLNDWIDSGDPAVSSELSNQRAATCVKCPQNGKGDFTKWFTKPAADAIRKQVERLQDRKLSTEHDDQINICEVCLCPLRLKVHTPFKHIESHLSPEVIDDLRKVPGCWMISELGKTVK